MRSANDSKVEKKELCAQLCCCRRVSEEPSLLQGAILFSLRLAVLGENQHIQLL